MRVRGRLAAHRRIACPVRTTGRRSTRRAAGSLPLINRARRELSAGLSLVRARLRLALSVPLRLQRYTVQGRSMEPHFFEGDYLLVLSLRPGQRPRPGEVVVALDPRDSSRTLIKRAAAVDRDLGIWLLGDCPPFSTDSRTFGYLPVQRIQGRVLFTYWPLRRLSRCR